MLRHLEVVSLRWRGVYESVFDLNCLASINITNFPDKELTRWKRNELLKVLQFESKKLEELIGIDRFPKLDRLELYRCPELRSLAAIATSTSIQLLSLQNCTGILDLSPVAHLNHLKELRIEDCRDILSVAPIAKCKKLEFLQIAGNTTVMDGDLSPLKRLPRLKKVLLVDRKHYSHTDDQLVSK